MLTKDERWKLNHAHKFVLQAERLLDECTVRKHDADSAAVLDAALQIARCREQLEAIVSRLGQIPVQPAEELRKPARRAGSHTWGAVPAHVIDLHDEVL